MERERACRAVYYLLQYRKHTFVFAASQCYIAFRVFLRIRLESNPESERTNGGETRGDVLGESETTSSFETRRDA